MIVDELMPALYKEYNISKDPERHGIGGAAPARLPRSPSRGSGPNEFRKVLSLIGSFVNFRGGHAYADSFARARRNRSGSTCRMAATTTAALDAAAPTIRYATGSCRTTG